VQYRVLKGKSTLGMRMNLRELQTVMISQNLTLSVAGNRAVNYVRKRLFFRILREDAGWFDRAENKISVLTTRLSNDAGSLHCVSTRLLLLVSRWLPSGSGLFE
jgi:hypothetical protein